MHAIALCLILFAVPPEGHGLTLEAPPVLFDGEGGHWDGGRADGHAPIAVMGEHTHGGGEVMLSYRFMTMFMKGNRDGTSKESNSDVFAEGFMIAPQEMTMNMHMFGFMAAPSDTLTLMFMLNYVDMEMDHETMGGVKFTTRADGLGDSRVTGLYKFYEHDGHHLHANVGFSLPSGSINEEDRTPMGPNMQLPYPMQLGSGTLDFLPGVTYLGQTETWSWGSQLNGTVRLGRNENGYALGDRVGLSAWLAKPVGTWFSASIRLAYEYWGNVNGQDEELPAPMPNMVPTADPGRRGGSRLDALVGFNLYSTQGFTKGHRLAAEFGIPVYQDLRGPQLETDWLLTLGWQWAF